MIISTLTKVFSKPRYIVLSVSISLIVFAFVVWLPNWKLISTVFTSSSVNFSEALSITFGLLLSIKTNFTILAAVYTVLISLLFGTNIALLTYYFLERRGRLRGRGSVLGIGGLVSGMLGVGCAACGTFILSSTLALIGGVGVLTYLPLGGGEFGIIGVILLIYATYWTLKKISEPLVC